MKKTIVGEDLLLSFASWIQGNRLMCRGLYQGGVIAQSSLLYEESIRVFQH
jgi:hypothetical protein